MQSFNLKILTSDGVKFDGQAQSVTLRGDTGDVTILARHIDYVTALGIGKAKVVNADGEREQEVEIYYRFIGKID